MKALKTFSVAIVGLLVIFGLACMIMDYNFALGATFDIMASGYYGWRIGKLSASGYFGD